jgi:hypothetical protein
MADMDAERPTGGDVNPYSAPAVAVDAFEAGGDSALEITRDEAESFVGKNHLNYYGTWRRAKPGKDLFIGFNWPAGLLNGVWLLYRKMYRDFFVFIGVLLAMSAGTKILAGVSSGNAANLERAVNLAVAIVVGSMGNGLYLRTARRVIAAARAEEPDPQRRLALLAKRGGTSLLAVLVGFLGFVALSVSLALALR